MYVYHKLLCDTMHAVSPEKYYLNGIFRQTLLVIIQSEIQLKSKAADCRNSTVLFQSPSLLSTLHLSICASGLIGER